MILEFKDLNNENEIKKMINYYNNHNWRGVLFNRIIKELCYSSYLELGVSTGEKCYNLIECESKVGVDANSNLNIPGVISLTTDEYFNSLDSDIKFDLIYIDACHEKYQVYNDFCNSINHLNKGGMIILHDIFPLTEELTSVEMSNGNVYEMWIELVKNYPDKTATFIGFPGDPEGTIGIYFDSTEDLFDKNKIKKINYSYSYFSSVIPKYIYHKTITEDEIISKGRGL
jgi:hypothetical protein